MSPVALFLLALAAIFLIGALGEIIFQRTQIPDVIWLILAGIVLGESVTGFVSRGQLAAIAPYFAALTLVVVLFEGGSALKLAELARSASRSVMLALITFAFSLMAIASLSMVGAQLGLFGDSWTWSHGVLLGAILGGSSSIIIMPAMAIAKVEQEVAGLVSLESALTDAFCVVGTAAMIDIMLSDGASGGSGPLGSLVQSFGVGLLVGLVAGVVWIPFIRFLNSSEHAYPVTLSVLLLLFVLIDHLGGSAALGILTFAVMVGNARPISQRIGLREEVELDMSLRGFHRQIAFMVKSFFFVFIGAMLGPPWSLIGVGVLLGVILLVARVPGVSLGLARSGLLRSQRLMVVVSMPRGMAAGVLATLPVSAGVAGTERFPVMVFACVFTSILIFAVGFPLLRREQRAATERGLADPAMAPVARVPEAGPGPAAPPLAPEDPNEWPSARAATAAPVDGRAATPVPTDAGRAATPAPVAPTAVAPPAAAAPAAAAPAAAPAGDEPAGSPRPVE